MVKKDDAATHDLVASVATPILEVGRCLRDIHPGMETVFDLAENLEEGKKLTVIQRTVNPEPPVEPEIARRPKRNFTFHGIDGFINYVQANKTDRSLILADAMQLKAVFVYNENSETDYETAEFRPTLHPLLVKWMGLRIPAKDFALFVMENRSCIVGGMIGEIDKESQESDEMLTPRQIAMLFRQVRTSKSVTIESGTGPRSINGVMVEVKIGSSAEVHQIPMQLPDRIVVRVPLFVHSSDSVELEFDVLVFNGPNDQPMVSVTNSDIQTMIAKSFSHDISRLGELIYPVVTALGSYDISDWKCVR